MLCYAVDLARDQVHGDIFYLTGRDAAINGAAFDLGPFQHYGAGRDDSVAANLGIVHDDGAHTY